ncbi:MAG: alpha/beta hydrolase [Chloroflexi bacterium]|nr:alpha/beta hydrolase [Chloroflexota bacterium]
MPLHPAVKTLLDQVAAQNSGTLSDQGVEMVREGYVVARGFLSEKPDIANVEDRAIPGPAGDIPVRIYTPAGQGPYPILVYYHGGGWVIGSIETHDGISRAYANAAGCIVVNVDYRLAPEHKFPAAADDAFAALNWVADHAVEFDGDPSRIAVGGESAGANLAAVVAQLATEAGGPALAYQILAYPVTNLAFDTESYETNADGYFLTQESMRWFWSLYLNDESEGADPKASPLLREDVSGLAPGIVIAPEFDPLRDEGIAYGKRLQGAGVDFEVWVADGMIHEFLGMTNILPESKAAIERIAANLKTAFGK